LVTECNIVKQAYFMPLSGNQFQRFKQGKTYIKIMMLKQNTENYHI